MGNNEISTKEKINTYPPLFNTLFVGLVQQTGYFLLSGKVREMLPLFRVLTANQIDDILKLIT